MSFLWLNSFWGFFCAQIPPVVSRGSLATIPSGMTREDDSGRSHNTKRGAFHEIFNLPETERPLPGAPKRGIVNSVSAVGLLFEIIASVLCLHSVREWMEVLFDQSGPENAHWLHPQRSALCYWKVRRLLMNHQTCCVVSLVNLTNHVPSVIQKLKSKPQ